jgi:hypothetical protein
MDGDHFVAAIELRPRFPGVTDNAQAVECARTIAGWMPLRPVKRMPNGYVGSADAGRLPNLAQSGQSGSAASGGAAK